MSRHDWPSEKPGLGKGRPALGLSVESSAVVVCDTEGPR